MKNAIHLRKIIIAIVVIFAAGLVIGSFGCGGSTASTTDDGDGNGTGDTTPPTITDVTPQNYVTINNSMSIVFSFDESMDPNTLVLGGTMSGQSDGGVWSTTTNENDTLTISPASSWIPGTSTLTVAVSDLSGNALPTSSMTKDMATGSMVYGIQTVYVRSGGSGDGTMDSPMGDINAATASAQTNLGDGTWASSACVEVATGTYEVTSGTDHIQLVEGVSLYGGFSDTDWTVRDPSTYTATIRDKSSTNTGIWTNPNRAVEAGSGITSATTIDGFNIEGTRDGGDHSSGIFNNNGAAPTISNNTIDGGVGATSTTAGILNDEASPIIINNTIDGGGSTGSSSYGIRSTDSTLTLSANTISGGSSTSNYTRGVYSASGDDTVYGNTINGGNGSVGSTGYDVYDTTAVIYNNAIHGGYANNYSEGLVLDEDNYGLAITVYNNTIHGGSGGGYTYGIEHAESSPKIYNNTINGGDGTTTSRGIELNDDGNGGGSPEIYNNIIFTSGSGTRYCIDEDEDGADPVYLYNNNIFDCPNALYYDYDTSSYMVNIANVNGMTTGTNGTDAGNNTDEDLSAIFVDLAGGDWHLKIAVTGVTDGGLDGSAQGWGFTTDKDGTTRTAPWSMGAYEYD